MDKFLAILKLIPTIIAMVHVAESVIPGASKGTQKLNLVLNTVGAAAQSVPDIAGALSAKDINAAATAIAGAAVSTLNEAGVFAKAS